jgi:hypothetical protein
MAEILHRSAQTTPRVRSELPASKETTGGLPPLRPEPNNRYEVALSDDDRGNDNALFLTTFALLTV